MPTTSPRTAKATVSRKEAYDAKVKAIVPHVAKAREFDVIEATNLANWLDCHGVPSPSGGQWSKSAMLRALRRLRQLGLEGPPLKPLTYADLKAMALGSK